jgi:hypothetical protein
MDAELSQIIEMLVMLAAAIIAYIQTMQKNKAENRTAELVSYFDPADESVTTAPQGLPARTYRMSESTKRWLTFDHPAAEQASLLQQVAEAEAGKMDTYTVTVPSAWYEIEYGLIKASGKGMA